MKRGRRSDEYPRAEFVATVRRQMKLLGITQTALADHSYVSRDGELIPVPRGTVSWILAERRPASREVRYALMETLEFDGSLKAKFGGEAPLLHRSAEPVLISGYNYPQPALLGGVSLLIRGFYPAAAEEFRLVMDRALTNRDLALQADAAARMAWLHVEKSNLPQAGAWAQRSIRLALESLGVPMREILCSAVSHRTQDGSAAIVSATRILSDALHLRGQVLGNRMLYLEHDEVRSVARQAFNLSLALDRRLDLPELIGNDLRWSAVIEVTGTQPNLKSSLRYIDGCKDKFPPGGLYEGHLVNARGVINVLTGRPARARDLFIEAGQRIASSSDARGLALNNYLLGSAILRSSNNRREALHCGIASAALHPYGFVLERSKQQARYSNQRDLQREIDDLLAARGGYLVVHQMMARLARDSGYSAEDLLYRNIELMLDDGFPSVTVPFRRESWS